MSNTLNIYCDESCHLLNDGHKVMTLGALWCPLDYFLLKTAFHPLRRGKREKLERDWRAAQGAGNG